MKKLILSLFLLAAAPLAAQTPFWQASTGPFGGSLMSLVKTADGDLLAGTTSGLWRSTDDGGFWSSMLPQLRDSNVNTVVETGSGALLVASGPGTVWRSTDDGATWSFTWTDALNPEMFATLPGEPVYLASSEGVYRSTDDGVTWMPGGAVPGSARGLYLPAPDSLLLVTYDGMLVSADSAKSWKDFGGSTLDGTFTLVPAGGDEFFVLTVRGDEDQLILRSTDRGVTWDSADAGIDGMLIGGLAGAGGDVYATTFGGTARWNGATERWEIASTLEEYPVFIEQMAATGNGLLASTNEGVFRTTDRGVTWMPASNGMTSGYLRSVAIAPNGDVYTSMGEGLYRSSDVGQTWSRTALNMGVDAIAFAANGAVLAGAWNGLHRSTDNGATWTRDSLGQSGEDAEIESIVRTSNGTLFAVGEEIALVRSTDNGVTWTPLEANGDGNAMMLAAGPTGELFLVMSSFGTVERSTDNGETWAAYGPRLTGGIGAIRPLANGDLLLGDLNGQVYRYDAAAGTTTGIGPEEDAGITAIVVDRDGTIYASSWHNGVFRRTPGGTSWEHLIGGLGMMSVNDLAIHPSGYLFAALGGGSIQRSLSPISGVEQENHPATAFSIAPIPATDALTIGIQLEAGAEVSVRLLDMNGAQVATIPSRYLPAGASRLGIALEGIPAGSYLCEVVADGRRSVRSVQIVR